MHVSLQAVDMYAGQCIAQAGKPSRRVHSCVGGGAQPGPVLAREGAASCWSCLLPGAQLLAASRPPLTLYQLRTRATPCIIRSRVGLRLPLSVSCVQKKELHTTTSLGYCSTHALQHQAEQREARSSI